MVVPAGARGAVLGEQLTGRRPREPAALPAEMRLVVVTGVDRPPREVDVGGVRLGDRGLHAGDEALETQDAVELLGADADRRPATTPQLALGDRQQARAGWPCRRRATA